MLRLLIPVEENESREAFLSALIRWLKRLDSPAELHLIHIQTPMPRDVGMFISQENLDDFQREEGMKQLSPSMAQLDAAGLSYRHHIFVGEAPETIVRFAEEQGIHQIVMGHQPTNAFANLLHSSVSTRVMQLAHIPVMLIR